jgi:hypothetical protein
MGTTTRLLRTALLAGLVCATAPAAAGRMDQRAADLYHKGVKLIQAGRFEAGGRLVWQALERGATEPNEAQGGESRYIERRYDPYYWLGVAEMEAGSAEMALMLFEISESYSDRGSAPVITRWRSEYRDLKRRKDILLRDRAARTPDSP